MANGQAYVYKITFPNGKIYIGCDWGKVQEVVTYFGSPTVRQKINDEHRHLEKVGEVVRIEKEILFIGTRREALQKEREFIKSYQATNLERGYNLR